MSASDQEQEKKLSGFLIIDKPLKMTSMNVIRHVRRRCKKRKTKVGHAGTLDPLATGVLIVCIGKGTKCVEQLMDLPKIYEAAVDLRAFTPSDDLEGGPESLEPVEVCELPTTEKVGEVLKTLTGEVEQTPSIFSAIKIDGKPAYSYARKGKEVEIRSRKIQIYTNEVLNYEWPKLQIRVACSRGTYIRTLARQIGTALGTGGHLTGLKRTAVGHFSIEKAHQLDALPDPIEQDHLLPLGFLKEDHQQS